MPFPSSFWIFHFVYSWCICVCAKLCPTLLWPKGLQPTRLLCPWNFPGKNIGKGFHFLFQGIFQTKGSNSHLLHWQVDSLPLHHLGSLYFWYLPYTCDLSHSTIFLLPPSSFMRSIWIQGVIDLIFLWTGQACVFMMTETNQLFY